MGENVNNELWEAKKATTTVANKEPLVSLKQASKIMKSHASSDSSVSGVTSESSLGDSDTVVTRRVDNLATSGSSSDQDEISKIKQTRFGRRLITPSILFGSLWTKRSNKSEKASISSSKKVATGKKAKGMRRQAFNDLNVGSGILMMD